MNIDEGQQLVGVNSSGRLALNERFEKIQGARPGPPLAEEGAEPQRANKQLPPRRYNN